jgi:transcriptional regulator of acetoin/glycerol metabolism
MGYLMSRDAAEIRAALSEAAKRRGEADDKRARERARENAEIVKLLRQVNDTDGISMSEAADVLGVSRAMIYKLLG